MTLRVPYQVMDEQHTIMRKAAQDLDALLDTIRDGLQRLNWQGTDRAAYNEAQRSWDASVGDMNTVLNEIAMAVGYARENYETTEMENSRLWQR